MMMLHSMNIMGNMACSDHFLCACGCLGIHDLISWGCNSIKKLHLNLHQLSINASMHCCDML